MAVRSSMAALIARVRLLISDPAGAGQTWADQDIQDILDFSRQDLRYLTLAPAPTFTAATISYLDYYSDIGDWEDDLVLYQWRINLVTPATSENIVGHWTFTNTVLPPVYLIGKTYDTYRAAADILDRWAAKFLLAYNITVNGQNLQRSQIAQAMQKQAQEYRKQQRPYTIGLMRGDLVNKSYNNNLGLGPLPIDYMGSGDGR